MYIRFRRENVCTFPLLTRDERDHTHAATKLASAHSASQLRRLAGDKGTKVSLDLVSPLQRLTKANARVIA